MGDLIHEISKLSIAERIRLVQAILDTIAADNSPEVERRSAAIADASTPTVSWESIQVKLEQRYCA